MRLAPIALFVFRRPELTRALLESLRANPEAARSRVYVFCDGPRDARDLAAVAATREVIRSAGLVDRIVVEHEANRGLAASVIEGVTRVCREHGRVIVLEDDLLLAPTFLAFMNEALERYEDAPRVHAVSGYMYPVPPPPGVDALFLPVVGSWGWATWARAWSAFDATASGRAVLARRWRLRRRFDLGWSYPYWKLLEMQRRGEADSWAIRWYLSVFLQGGLSVFPARSLVEHRGVGADATHWTRGAPPSAAGLGPAAFEVRRWPAVEIDGAALRSVRRFLAREYGPWPRLLNALYRRQRAWRGIP